MVVNTIIIIVTIIAITITAVSSKDKGEGQLGAGGITKAFYSFEVLGKGLEWSHIPVFRVAADRTRMG